MRRFRSLLSALVLANLAFGQYALAAVPHDEQSDKIGTQIYDWQLELGDDFKSAMETVTDTDVLASASADMAKAQAQALAKALRDSHVYYAGTWSITSTATGTAAQTGPSIDVDIPAVAMQLDGSSYVALWWKTGTDATDWVKLGGGTGGALADTGIQPVSTGTATAAGTATEGARADHEHTLPTSVLTALPTNVVTDTDLVHKTDTIGATDGLAVRAATGTSTGTSTALGASPVVVPVYGTTVQPLDTSSASGTTKQPADSGHKHPLPTDLVRSTDTLITTNTNNVTSTGLTPGKLTKAKGARELDDSVVFQSTDGRIGIGTANPFTLLDVRGLVPAVFPKNPALAALHATDNPAQDSGAGMLFGGRYSSSDANPTEFGYVGAVKESATDGDWAGKLVFGVRSAGSFAVDMTKMVLSSLGNLTITGSVAAANIVTMPATSVIPNTGTGTHLDNWISAAIARATDTRFGIATNFSGAVSKVGTDTWAGTSTNVSHGDHIHGHGAQPIGDGTNHAAVTASYNGFATPAMLAASTNAVTSTGLTSGKLTLASGTRAISDSVVTQSSGQIGIGTATPATLATLIEGWGAARVTFPNNPAVAGLYATNAYAAGMGGGVMFGGKYNSGGGATEFGYVGAVKENATDGNYAGKLVFGTRAHGTGGVDMTRMTLSSGGDLAISGSVSAGNINTAVGTSRIPSTTAGSPWLDSWISYTNAVVQSLGNGTTTNYLPISVDNRRLGDSYLYQSGGLLYTANASQTTPGAYKVVVDNATGVISGEHFPHTTTAPKGAGIAPASAGSSGYLSREDHRHPPQITLNWARLWAQESPVDLTYALVGQPKLIWQQAVYLGNLPSDVHALSTLAGTSTGGYQLYWHVYLSPTMGSTSGAVEIATNAFYSSGANFIDTNYGSGTRPCNSCYVQVWAEITGSGTLPVVDSFAVTIEAND